MIKSIFFDVVGTLLFPDPPPSEVYFEIGAQFGSRYSLNQITARFRQAFRRQEETDEQANWRTSEERERRRWRDIVNEVLDDVAQSAKCFDAIYQRFGQPDAWRLADDADAVLADLHERNIGLGLASNYDERLRRLVDAIPALQFCRHIAISSEIGWRKPAAEFFGSVVQMAGMPPSQILFVGDDHRNDYLGAKTAGLHSVLLKPDGGDKSVAGDEIGSIRQIVALLND